MIIAYIKGALGNQLFCYASTRCIALDLEQEYRYFVEPHGYGLPAVNEMEKLSIYIDGIQQEYSYYWEEYFSINNRERVNSIDRLNKNGWRYYKQPPPYKSHDKGVYDILSSTVLDGFWFNPMHFNHRRKEVLSWFDFRPDIRKKMTRLKSKIQADNPEAHLASLHVRYTKAMKENNVAINPAYYQHAMERLKQELNDKKILFLIFSNDIALAKQFIPENENVMFLHGNMFEDLCLMSKCDSHILANSTFSWWGAWLDQKDNGVTIRPSRYPSEEDPVFVNPEFYPEHWIVVDSKKP